MSSGPKFQDEKKLRETLLENPADWETRKQLAHVLYDKGSFAEAADAVWEADEIPSVDVELAFAARILAKAAPRKAIRLLTALLEHNKGKAVQNLGLANALLHHGMVLQAARFYGAALEADPSFGNPELEHFILWTDDEETLWGGFQNRRPVLGDLPWMTRDPREALKLTSRINTHTTPIKLPSLNKSASEDLGNDLYQQKAEKGADPTPPPAVTIPLDRVDPKYRLFDDELGAPEPELPLALDEPATPALPAAAAMPAPLTPAPVKPSTLTPPPSRPVVPPPPGGVAIPPPPRKELAKPDFSAAGSSPKPTAPVLDDEESLEVATSAPAPPMTPPPGTNRPRPPLPPLKKP